METAHDSATEARRLERHFLFRSGDLEYTRSILSRLYRSHGLDVASTRGQLDVTTRYARLHHSSLSYLHYGTDVRMRPRRKECLESFLVVQIPLSGRARISCGKETLVSSPAVASVVTPSLPLEMDWSADCRQITLRIERSHIERHCETLLGGVMRQPLEFALGMPVHEAPGRRWMRLMQMVLDELDDPEAAAPSPLLAREWEQALMTCLLVEHPNTYRERLARPTPDVLPRHVKRVIDYIEAHADQPLTAQALAQVADVKVGAIYAGFRKYCGMAPLQYLRRVRMQRVRTELLAAQPGRDTVSDVAYRWGFTHLGRFGQAYRRRFGETPSDTLRR